MMYNYMIKEHNAYVAYTCPTLLIILYDHLVLSI